MANKKEGLEEEIKPGQIQDWPLLVDGVVGPPMAAAPLRVKTD